MKIRVGENKRSYAHKLVQQSGGGYTNHFPVFDTYSRLRARWPDESTVLAGLRIWVVRP